MNQVFTGTVALIIALLLWGLGKKPRVGLNANANQASLGTINNPQLSLVQKNTASEAIPNNYLSNDPAILVTPKTIQERIILRKQLYQLITGSPNDRLKAIKLTKKLNDKSVLPILRRGLKDSNSSVVLAASKALEKHRGPIFISDQEKKTLRPPLNVSLTR